jgi:hypothetical protein
MEVIRACKDLPISIYLMTMNPDITEPIWAPEDKPHLIQIPGQNSLIPGVLEMTIQSLEYVHSAKLPGYQHKYLLRTNLSSFWCFQKYLQYIKDEIGEHGIYNGIVGTSEEYPFVSGSGFLLSNDAESILRRHKEKLDFSVLDDVSIGKLLLEHAGIHPNPLTAKRTDYTAKTTFEKAFPPPDAYHYRVKTDVHGAQQDMAISSYLLMHCYGDSLTTTQLGDSSTKKNLK